VILTHLGMHGTGVFDAGGRRGHCRSPRGDVRGRRRVVSRVGGEFRFAAGAAEVNRLTLIVHYLRRSDGHRHAAYGIFQRLHRQLLKSGLYQDRDDHEGAAECVNGEG